ncbi:MAG: hypothetical protein P4L84_06015 [Isosphaeraceae bacterium]|nr:hypothetical protein [Isosphaeraceae bacterium]
MNDRRHRPALESLERREVPVGFMQGPPVEPIQLSLSGTAQGTAVVSSSAGVTTIRVAADGRITPLGLTSLSGRLEVRGTTESGVLVVNSPKSHMTLEFQGPAGGALRFHIVDGMGTLPNTTWQFVREDGAGTLTLSTVGIGRGPASLTIHPFR